MNLGGGCSVCPSRSLVAVKIRVSKHSGVEARRLELVTMRPTASWCHLLELAFSVGQRKGLSEVMSKSLGGDGVGPGAELAPPPLPREPTLHSS